MLPQERRGSCGIGGRRQQHRPLLGRGSQLAARCAAAQRPLPPAGSTVTHCPIKQLAGQPDPNKQTKNAIGYASATAVRVLQPLPAWVRPKPRLACSLSVADTVTNTWCRDCPSSKARRQWSNMRNTWRGVVEGKERTGIGSSIVCAERASWGPQQNLAGLRAKGAGQQPMLPPFHLPYLPSGPNIHTHRTSGLASAAAAQQDDRLWRVGAPLNHILQRVGESGSRGQAQEAGLSASAGLMPSLLHLNACLTGARCRWGHQCLAANTTVPDPLFHPLPGPCRLQPCWPSIYPCLTASAGDSRNLKSTSVCPSLVITAGGSIRAWGRQAQP